jgi:hypothetical protein
MEIAMPKPKDNSALSFIGQIQTEHKAVLKADGEALQHAIECGKALNLAKENVLAAEGKWGKWREEHIPEISQQTASLYMRLAEYEEAIAECTSIRQADEKLRKPRGESDSDESTDSDETDDTADEEEDDDDTNNALLKRELASASLTSIFKNVAPDEVFAALKDTWDREQLVDLANRLTAHVKSLDLNIPSQLRRAPSAPAAQTN